MMGSGADPGPGPAPPPSLTLPPLRELDKGIRPDSSSSSSHRGSTGLGQMGGPGGQPRSQFTDPHLHQHSHSQPSVQQHHQHQQLQQQHQQHQQQRGPTSHSFPQYPSSSSSSSSHGAGSQQYYPHDHHSRHSSSVGSLPGNLLFFFFFLLLHPPHYASSFTAVLRRDSVCLQLESCCGMKMSCFVCSGPVRIKIILFSHRFDALITNQTKTRPILRY